jgi:pyruvate/2-oxoglutarate dehydrogenase complex dihydrolipoamide acyltransferase (E2) component
VDGAPAVRPMLSLTFSFDHRVVDGARAAEFGLALIRRLEG